MKRFGAAPPRRAKRGDPEIVTPVYRPQSGFADLVGAANSHGNPLDPWIATLRLR